MARRIRSASQPPPTVRVTPSRALALLATAALLAALLPGVALAHVPVLEPGGDSSAAGSPDAPFPEAVAIPDPTVSRAVYGVLMPDAPYDVYEFTPSKDAEIPLALLVPARGALRGFRPALALVAEQAVSVVSSTPPPPGAFGRTPIRHPDLLLPREAAPALIGRSVFVVRDPGDTPRPTFFEPFTMTRYWTGGEMRVRVLGGQRYRLVVWADGSKVPSGGAEYVIGAGEAEAFNPLEWLGAAGSLARVETRSYGGAKPGPGRLGWVVLGIVVLVAAVVLVRRRRAASTQAATPAEDRTAG